MPMNADQRIASPHRPSSVFYRMALLALAGVAAMSVRAETPSLPPAAQTAPPALADLHTLTHSRWQASLDAFAVRDRRN